MMKKIVFAVLFTGVCAILSAQDFTAVKLENADFAKVTKNGQIASWGTFNRDWPGIVKTVKESDGSTILSVQPTKSPTQPETMAMLSNETKFAAVNGDTIRVRFLFRLKKMDRAALGSSVVLSSSNGGKYNMWMSTFRSVMKMPVPNVWTKYDKTIVVAKQPKAGTFYMNVHVRGKEVEFRDFAVEVKKGSGK